ncbi:Qat anti-phage system QueC-like protein QatC [Oceanobacillus sp. 1P07AA]|uniref:Qat anti-phage system QueC-like protein QatC n=1 Tax=Oceanobacillus sp. 1P07AA TaxID=3132293 RepID=UPI0039A5235F
MINVWINKNSNDFNQNNVTEEQFLLFQLLDKKNKSNVKTDMEQLWRRFGLENLPSINEDFLIIASSIFCADKRIPRKIFSDNWSRTIKLFIPVLELEKWNSVKDKLQETIGFLSGDEWKFEFRKTNSRFRGDKRNTKNIISPEKYDSVSLFSGGLDSFCGALTLSEKEKNTCYVGFREYSLLTNRQKELFSAIQNSYSDLESELLLFNVNPFVPQLIGYNSIKLSVESTSRSRSLLFIAGAMAVASIIDNKTPVYIPENGFIGVNVPLTDSRAGSCSTRTTHPIFINLLNNIFRSIGIENKVSNFYWNKSKGEILEEHKENIVFVEKAHRTLSCSHPCLSRYDKKRSDQVVTPCNCGYCYPCLIRRASFNKIKKDETNYNPLYKLSREFILNHNNLQGRASDLKAVLFSLRRYIQHKDDQEYIRSLLLRQGPLTNEELDGYEKVYRQSMDELKEMINESKSGLLEYAGLKEA